jgi:hypothetical protein
VDTAESAPSAPASSPASPSGPPAPAPLAPPGVAQPGESPPGSPAGVGYWRRTAILAAVVVLLLVLSWLDDRRLPDEPFSPGSAATVPSTGLPRD